MEFEQAEFHLARFQSLFILFILSKLFGLLLLSLRLRAFA